MPASLLLGLMLREGWNRVPDGVREVWSRCSGGLLVLSALLLLAAPFFVPAGGWNVEQGMYAGISVIALVAIVLLARSWHHWNTPAWQAVAGGVVMAAFSLSYALVVVPRLAGSERVRPLAEQIVGSMPPDAPLYAFDPDSQPAFFYLSRPPRFVLRAADLPDDGRFVFVPEEFIPRLREGGRWDVEKEVIRYVDRGGRVLLLVKVRRVS